LDLATVEDWGEEKFPEGVGVNWKNLYRSSIQDGGIANFIYYLAFRSKTTPVLQATNDWALFSAECTIGMVWGLTSLKQYGNKALWQ